MKKVTDCYTLANGVEIPCVGFGTWQTPDGEVAVTAVLDALEAGYRHIDTAAGYQNEESVGRAVKESGISRCDLFITSKLGNSDHGYEATLAAFEATMDKLDLDYLDLYLIHWPNPVKFRDCWEEANAGSWKAFEELYEAGRIKAIGVSNFMPRHLDALKKTAQVLPMVNQIKLCPGEIQEETAAYCRQDGILLEAYSPLGTGRIFESPEMARLAAKYNKTIAQVCLGWSLQMGYLPLPKSVTRKRIKENTDIFDFKLSDDDMDLIAKLEGYCKPAHNPDTTAF